MAEAQDPSKSNHHIWRNNIAIYWDDGYSQTELDYAWLLSHVNLASKDLGAFEDQGSSHSASLPFGEGCMNDKKKLKHGIY